MCHPTARPSYFDLSWQQILFKLSVDVNKGIIIKDSNYPEEEFQELVLDIYPLHVVIYTDASFNPVTLRAAISFFIPLSNTLFGLRVSSFLSILSLERLAIREALQFAILAKIRDIIIVTDSRQAIKDLSNPIIGKYKTHLDILDIVKLMTSSKMQI